MGYAIRVENLRKSYGDNEVLKGLTFDVEQGEIFGILGINGAGKTTTLECIEGFRRYDGGSIRVCGSIGIQLQSASLPAYIRPMEAVRLIAGWKGAKAEPEMLSALGVDALSRKRYMDLSTGQKRRLHLALAMIGRPDILFLDEPTAGLDVEGRLSLHEQIRRLRQQGTTMVLASHDMAEVEALCTRIAILNRGQIAFLGTTAELTDKVQRCYNIKVVTDQGEETCVAENIGETMLAILEECRRRERQILDIQISRGTLEQHFLDIAKGA